MTSETGETDGLGAPEPRGLEPGLQPGDLCHHGTNALPLYRVIWVDDGRVWLRDVNTDVDSVVPLGRCSPCLEEVSPATLPTPITWPDGTPRP